MLTPYAGIECELNPSYMCSLCMKGVYGYAIIVGFVQCGQVTFANKCTYERLTYVLKFFANLREIRCHFLHHVPRVQIGGRIRGTGGRCCRIFLKLGKT